jgi:hypothetical protein
MMHLRAHPDPLLSDPLLSTVSLATGLVLYLTLTTAGGIHFPSVIAASGQ